MSTWFARWWSGFGLVVLATVGTAADLSTRLAALAETSTLAITTAGRKTGKSHTVPVWFVVDGPSVLLGTLDVRRDWVRNAAKTPAVEVAIGTARFRGQLSTVADPVVSQRFHERLAKKYWVAWAGSFFAKGPERVFRIDGLVPVE